MFSTTLSQGYDTWDRCMSILPNMLNEHTTIKQSLIRKHYLPGFLTVVYRCVYRRFGPTVKNSIVTHFSV